jgi:hypothetical protein
MVEAAPPVDIARDAGAAEEVRDALGERRRAGRGKP